MLDIRDSGYVRKTRVYVRVLAMGKKTQKRFHHQTSLCSLPLPILHTPPQRTKGKTRENNRMAEIRNWVQLVQKWSKAHFISRSSTVKYVEEVFMM
jgi:hypothetical protein